jgi:hypothetical protein
MMADQSGRVGAEMAEPSGLWAVLGVTGAASIVVAQPVYEVLTRSPEFFVVRRSSPATVVLFALGLLAPGAVLGTLVGLVGRQSVPRRRVAMCLVLAVVAGTFALQLGVRFGAGSWWLVLAVAAAASAAGVFTFKTGGFRWFVSLLSFAAPIFLLAFLIQMPIVELWSPAPTITAPTELKNTVVFVVFDEFPTVSLLDADGTIDGSRFPNFARLASTSTWYRNASTVHSHTAYAVPAILSGTEPGSRVPHYAAYPQTLFTVAGSQQAVIREPFTHLCPAAMCSDEGLGPSAELSTVGLTEVAFGLWQRLTLGAAPGEGESLTDPFGELAAAAATADQDQMLEQVNAAIQSGSSGQFQSFIDDLRPKTLNFLHVLLPHRPYRYYPDGTQYNNFETLEGLQSDKWVDVASAQSARQRHLLQVAEVDRLVGELQARLARESWFDEALIVLVADHGAAFDAGVSMRALSPENLGQIGFVPMLVKYPGQHEGLVDPRPVRTIDLFPTITEVLGLARPLQVDGRSLIDRSYQGTRQEITDVSTGTHTLPDPSVTLVELAARFARALPIAGIDGLFRPAPLQDWPGQDLDELTQVIPGSGPPAMVLNDGLTLHVSKASGSVPGFIQGEIEMRVPTSLLVVISERGVVLAVSPISASGRGTSRFAAMVDPGLLNDGPHSFDLFLYHPYKGVAQRLGYEGAPLYRLDEARGLLISDDGETYRIESSGDGLRGSVESVGWTPLHLAAESMYLVGWAVDEGANRGADRILVFADGVYASSAFPDIDLRDQIAALAGSTVTTNGFTAEIAYAAPGTVTDIRVFAIISGTALELELSDQVQALTWSGLGGS